MTELKVKCSSCGHIEKVAKVNSFTIASNENEQFNKWLEEHDKQIRAEIIAEISREMRLLYGNEYEQQIRADAINEFVTRFEEEYSRMAVNLGEFRKYQYEMHRLAEDMGKEQSNE